MCVWARTLDQRRIYISFSVCFGLKRFKNEEYTLYLACVWARTLDERRIYILYLSQSIVFSLCFGSHTLRTRNIHCISAFGLAHFIQFTNGISGCRDGEVVRALASHQCGPGSIPRSGVKCGLSLLVLFSAPRGFLRVLRFPLSPETKIWNWLDCVNC